MKSIVFVYITERKNILKTPPPIRFIPSPKEVREKMNGILGGAVAVLLEVTFFFLLPLLKKVIFGGFSLLKHLFIV